MNPRCAAIGCEYLTASPRYLMCYGHWAMVNAPLQKTIWRLYREEGNPKPGYAEARRSAIEQAAQGEGKSVVCDPYAPPPVVERPETPAKAPETVPERPAGARPILTLPRRQHRLEQPDRLIGAPNDQVS